MKLRSIITLILFLIISSVSDAQIENSTLLDQSELLIKKDGKYIYGDNIFHFDELDHIMKSDPEAYEFYAKAIRKQRASANTLYAFFIAGGLSAVLITLNGSSIDTGDPNYFLLASGLILGTAAVVVILPLYIIQVPLTWRFKNRSIKTFNENRMLERGYKNNLGHLGLGMTGHGIGLVYSF